MQYHGKRLPGESDNFFVKEIIVSDSGDSISVIFSSPVDPRSVSHRSLKINGLILGDEGSINYNKAGDVMRISFSFLDNGFFSLELVGVKSFNGSRLSKSRFENLQKGKRSIFWYTS